ncbi:MAG TPA: amidohydrolase [Thermoanaerobaculia bacterium]
MLPILGPHALALALKLLLAFPAPLQGAGDLVLLANGVVYASPGAAPVRASILVEDGRVRFVGEPAAARAIPGAAGARVVDLQGRFVFPGFADAHLHLFGIGHEREVADLRGAADAQAAAARVATLASKLPNGAWIEATGWDQNRWPGRQFPDAGVLDAALGNRPVVAARVDGHAVWVSSAALKAAGIVAATRDPEGGRILRRVDGSPSGVLVDNARSLVARVQPAPTEADLERQLLAGAAECAAFGLTEVQDASAYDPATIALLARLADRGALPIRIYATVSPKPGDLEKALAKGVRIGTLSDRLTVRAIKAYADGALGSRGAALLADYADEPGRRGLLRTSPERLAEIALAARRGGWQVWIHAIGDRGNRLALDAYEAAAAAVPEAAEGATRPRIEHAQVIAPEDFPRFARFGVIASIQPTHATSDMPWAEDRLGPSRIAGAYAWRRLVIAGARLAGGSDAPVESENPLLGFYAAVTREDLQGKPPGGWRAGEKLSRAEAMALFTSGAAYAAFEETWRGRIEPGFAADFTILERDPMAVPEEEIPSVKVFATVVAGRAVFGALSP